MPAKPINNNVQRVISAVPPQGLVLLAIFAIQLGAAGATHLFPILGPSGTVAVRIIFSALLLTLLAGNNAKTFFLTFKDNWPLLLVFGLCIAAMNLFFYQAIARIPLGTAVAIEFIGPLGLAAFTSRRLIHFAWIGLAALGIVLLSPLSGVDLDPLGIVFALMAGSAWALFIVLAGRIGKRIQGNEGLAIGMGVAAIIMIPLVIPVSAELVLNPLVLLAALLVAFLSTTIPFTLEFEALKRLSSRSYGILISLEPGVAALVGAILLGERIGLKGVIALACVMIAAIGISLTDKQTEQENISER